MSRIQRCCLCLSVVWHNEHLKGFVHIRNIQLRAPGADWWYHNGDTPVRGLYPFVSGSREYGVDLCDTFVVPYPASR